MSLPPEWQLPDGVSRETWSYLTDYDRIQSYDSDLDASPLLRYDLRIAEIMFAKPGKLVDLGCGTGRLLLPFARRGYSVLGIDLSAGMLKTASEKARAATLDVPLLRANLVDLECLNNGSFDYAACLFSTLGMIAGRVNRRRFLAHVRRILKPGGSFLLHVHNLWFHLGTRTGRRWLVRDRFSALTGADDAGNFTPPTNAVALHHFTRREALRELRIAGFRIISVVPVSLREDCRLNWPWLFGGFRAYGFLIGAEA
jgi:SAM-dependent methyltransferase